MSLVIDEHRQYLTDEHRLQAFAAAIARVVRPGDVVVDLASGTGILGLLACRAGAARVYAIEHTAIIELARGIARENGCADRIVHVQGLSGDVTLPERADVVIADQIGRFGFDAGIIEFFEDARRRFLKPGGRLVPCRLELHAAMVHAAAQYERIRAWDRRHAGFSFTSVRASAAQTGYPATLGPDELLVVCDGCAGVDLSQPMQQRIRWNTQAIAPNGATIQGLAGWFVAHLAPGVTMTNDPRSRERIDRRAVFLPVIEPFAVRTGDEVGIEIFVRPRQMFLSWSVQVSGRVQRQTTFGGMLIARSDVQRMRPDAVPQLTARGRARLATLQLCEAGRTVQQIESELASRYPDLFAGAEDAAAFAAEALSRSASVSAP